MSMPIKIPKITRNKCICVYRKKKRRKSEDQEKNEKNYGKKKRNVHKSLRSFVVVGGDAFFLSFSLVDVHCMDLFFT